MSILASDLMGNVTFDSKQTLPISNMNSNEYDEGMSLYLQMLGVDAIDKEYNAAVKVFESQLEEQEIAAKLSATMASESLADRTVEAQGNLGTGAAATASEGRQAALGSVYGDIEEQVAKSYQQGISGISNDYLTRLESVLGKYDESTGTFAGFSEYQTTANKATEAFAKVIAILNGATQEDTINGEYKEILKNAGFAKDVGDNNIEFTEAGQNKMDQLINGIHANTNNPALGNKTLMMAIAEQMAISDYSLAGSSAWEELSDTKRLELTKKYASWLQNNSVNLRVSSWQLYENTNAGLVVDTYYKMPDLATSDLYHEGVDIDSGIDVGEITENNFELGTKLSVDIAKLKGDILSGKIADGSYITVGDKNGRKYDDQPMYYVYDNTIYKSQYTLANPPDQISVDAASPYSFGVFSGTRGDTGKQNEWVQEIIDSAKAGNIPNGQLIQFNYGNVAGRNYGLYRYDAQRGTFTKVSLDEVSDWGSGTQTIGQLMAGSSKFREEHVIAYKEGGSGLTDIAEKYLDW